MFTRFTQQSSFPYLKFFVLAAVLILVSLGWFVRENLRATAPVDPVSYEEQERVVEELFINGEFEEAIEEYSKLIDSVSDMETIARLSLSQAYAVFYNPNRTPQEGAIALQTIANIIDDESRSNQLRGWALTGLLQLYYQSQQLDVHATIASLKVVQDSTFNSGEDTLLLSAAQIADAWHESTFSKLFLAVPRAAKIVQQAEELTETEKVLLAEEIVAYVEESYLFQPRESWFNDSFMIMLADHYRGILLGAASLGGVDPLLAAEAFSRAITSPVVDEIEYAQQLSVYTFFFYAVHMQQYGTQDLVIEITEDLIRVYQALEGENRSFGTFVRTAYEFPSSLNYSHLENLARMSPAFSTFLESEFSISFTE